MYCSNLPYVFLVYSRSKRESCLETASGEDGQKVIAATCTSLTGNVGMCVCVGACSRRGTGHISVVAVQRYFLLRSGFADADRLSLCVLPAITIGLGQADPK